MEDETNTEKVISNTYPENPDAVAPVDTEAPVEEAEEVTEEAPAEEEKVEEPAV